MRDQTEMEDEIYQLRGLIQLLATTAYNAENADFIFDIRADVIHGMLMAMERSIERVHANYHCCSKEKAAKRANAATA